MILAIFTKQLSRLAGLCAAIFLVLCGYACSSKPAATTAAKAVAGFAPAAASAATSTAMPPGQSYPSQGHTHLTAGEPDDFVYNSQPPTSGPHREIFSSAFISPTPLPSYVQVHLLEHGNVLLQYKCACPEIANALGAIAWRYDSKLVPANKLQPMLADVQNAEEQGMAVIVAPYPHMKAKVALTAWTRLATMSAVDKDRIASFINAYLHNATNAGQ